MLKLSAREFDRAVQRAIRRIPPQIRKHLDNMVISVQKWPAPELLEEMGLPPDEPLLGVYTGASLMERSHFDTLQYPDTIQIFQEPLEEMCETPGRARGGDRDHRGPRGGPLHRDDGGGVGGVGIRIRSDQWTVASGQ